MLSIDKDKCTACGICSIICPRHIPETIERDTKKITVISAERSDLCMECGHCEAVCPAHAIHVDKFAGDIFEPVPELNISENQLIDLMKHRRSVRRYKNKPVSRDIIERILEAVHLAPTGTGSRSTGVIVIDNPKILETLSDHFFTLYNKLEKVIGNPFTRSIFKMKKGKVMLNTLQNFVLPGMLWYGKWYRDGVSNEILRNCPVLILFYSPILEPMAVDNCTIAAFHAILMAELVGIGTCFNHLIPPACNNDSEVRDILNLPDDCEVYASLTAGYPKYTFKRTIPRRLAEVRYL